MNEERVKEIVDYCAEICLFDPVVWKMKCILTSRAIQSRYIDICKLAKKKMYIPLDILLVEPEQPIKEPVTMPLFEAATAAEPTGQNVPDVSVSPTTVEPTFEKVPEDFQNFPETSGNLPEKIDKEKKSKEKENEDYIRYSYYELKVKDNLSEEEIDEVLRISRDYFENKGYKVYFTNAEFEYQNAKRKVEINEYMIAFKE